MRNAVLILLIVAFSVSAQQSFKGITVSGGSTLYTPVDIQSLSNWWAPHSNMTIDTVGTNTASVWFDLRGVYNLITVTKDTQPEVLTAAVNGYRALRFDGVNDHITNAGVAGMFTGDDIPCWGFMIVRPFEAANTGAWAFGNSVTAAAGQFLGKPLQGGTTYRTTKVDDASTSVNNSLAGSLSNGWNYMAFSYSGTRMTACLNGAFNDVTYNAGPTTIDTFSVGALFRAGAFAQANQFDIAELGFGTGNVGTNVLNALYHQYAKPKYNLP